MSEEQTTQVTEPVETTQESTAPVAPTTATLYFFTNYPF